MNRNQQSINRILAVLVFLLGWASGTAAQESAPLVRADEPTPEQRQRWREALGWPTHCGGGIRERDDKDQPELRFLDAGDGRYLVYSLCSSNAYRSEVNLFLVETDRTEIKPRLLTFRVLEPIYAPDPDAEWVDSDDLWEEVLSLARRMQERVRYQARMSPLIEGRFSMAGRGRLVVDRRNNGPGTCGTHSTYDLDQDPPRLVGFRAQDECIGSSDIDTWKSYSQDYLDSVPVASAPTRTLDE